MFRDDSTCWFNLGTYLYPCLAHSFGWWPKHPGGVIIFACFANHHMSVGRLPHTRPGNSKKDVWLFNICILQAFEQLIISTSMMWMWELETAFENIILNTFYSRKLCWNRGVCCNHIRRAEYMLKGHFNTSAKHDLYCYYEALLCDSNLLDGTSAKIVFLNQLIHTSKQPSIQLVYNVIIYSLFFIWNSYRPIR